MTAAARRQDLAGWLTALSTSEIRVVYQPIIERRVDGRWQARQVEALVRSRDARGNRICPEEVVALAERCGESLTLATHVLDLSCEQTQQWERERNLALDIAVNLLPTTLVDERFPRALVSVLARHAIAPARVTLELSEAYPIADLNRARRAVKELCAIGVHCALDDLGAHYSTLWRAQTLGLDRVKIDRSLIAQVATDAATWATVRGWIDQAHEAGMDVTAEGVADRETLELLEGAQVDRMQGFYISRPVDAFDLMSTVRSWDRSRRQNCQTMPSDGITGR